MPGARPADLARGPSRRPGTPPWTRVAPGSRAANRSSSSSASAGPVARQQRGRTARCAAAPSRRRPPDPARRRRRPRSPPGARPARPRRTSRRRPGCPPRRAGTARPAASAVELRQPLRQQAALQRLGDPLLGPVEPGPIQRLGALLGERRAASPARPDPAVAARGTRCRSPRRRGHRRRAAARLTPRIPSRAQEIGPPGMGHGPLGRSTSSTQSGRCSRTASATASGEFSGTVRQPGPRRRRRCPAGPAARSAVPERVHLVHADGAAVAEETGEMWRRPRQPTSAGVVAADSSAVARCSSASRAAAGALVGQQQRVVQRQRGAARHLLDQHSIVVVEAGGVAVAPAAPSTAEHPTADGQRHRQRGPHGDPAVQRDPVRRHVRRPPCGADGRHVGQQAGAARGHHLLHGRRLQVHRRPGRPRHPRRRRRSPPGAAARRRRRRRTQHRSASRVSTTRRASPPSCAAGPDSRSSAGADRGQQALPLGLPVPRVDVGAAADVPGALVVGADGDGALEQPVVRAVGRGGAGTRPPSRRAAAAARDHLQVPVPVLGVQRGRASRRRARRTERPVNSCQPALTNTRVPAGSATQISAGARSAMAVNRSSASRRTRPELAGARRRGPAAPGRRRA